MHGVDIGRIGITMDREYVDVAWDSRKRVTAYQLITLCAYIANSRCSSTRVWQYST